MKYLLILILLQSFTAYSQNENPSRESFNLELVYDSLRYYQDKIEASPYFVKDQVLQIYPTEKVFIEVQLKNDNIESMKTVRKNIHPEKTIIIEFTQKVEKNKEQLMMLNTRNPFKGKLLFDAYIYEIGAKNWKKTSIIPIQPQNGSFEIWYNPISSIALENWRISFEN